MSLYARSDVVSVLVPTSSGGCSTVHSRPVDGGVPADDWNLENDCQLCAAVLRGDPLWAPMPAEIPETPDEKMIREDAEKRGERAIKKAQEQLSVRQHELTEKIVTLLERNGAPPAMDTLSLADLVHREVAKALAAAPAAEDQEPVPVISDAIPPGADLFRLHVRTLGKMCRERGLDDRGGKADLIARLNETAAAA